MSPTSPRQPGFGAGGQRHHAAAAAATTTPFKIHRDSHLIHKGAAAGASASSTPSSSSTNSSVSSSPGVGQQRPAPRPKKQQHQQQPVIIYTHSPKVIRTSPRDFMSIVQKLTGLESAAAASAVTGTAQDESSSSSTESCANAHAGPAPPPTPQYMDPPQLMPPPAQLDHAHFMPDIPLFAPAGASEHQQHLLCASGGGLYGHFPPTMDAGSLGGPANVHDGVASGVVFSPSMVEAMRTAYPDYQLT